MTPINRISHISRINQINRVAFPHKALPDAEVKAAAVVAVLSVVAMPIAAPAPASAAMVANAVVAPASAYKQTTVAEAIFDSLSNRSSPELTNPFFIAADFLATSVAHCRP